MKPRNFFYSIMACPLLAGLLTAKSGPGATRRNHSSLPLRCSCGAFLPEGLAHAVQAWFVCRTPQEARDYVFSTYIP